MFTASHSPSCDIAACDDDSHLHGRILTRTTTGTFFFCILDINNGSIIDPMPTDSRGRNSRITKFGRDRIVESSRCHTRRNRSTPRIRRSTTRKGVTVDDDDDDADD